MLIIGGFGVGIFWLVVMALFCAYVAFLSGRSPVGWFVLGLIGGVFAFILLLALGERHDSQDKYWVCHRCRYLASPKTSHCPDCGTARR